MFQQTQQLEEQEDTCTAHSMPYIALDTKTNELVCNMCVY